MLRSQYGRAEGRGLADQRGNQSLQRLQHWLRHLCIRNKSKGVRKIRLKSRTNHMHQGRRKNFGNQSAVAKKQKQNNKNIKNNKKDNKEHAHSPQLCSPGCTSPPDERRGCPTGQTFLVRNSTSAPDPAKRRSSARSLQEIIFEMKKMRERMNPTSAEAIMTSSHCKKYTHTSLQEKTTINYLPKMSVDLETTFHTSLSRGRRCSSGGGCVDNCLPET